jgi:hypothetical protein
VLASDSPKKGDKDLPVILRQRVQLLNYVISF